MHQRLNAFLIHLMIIIVTMAGFLVSCSTSYRVNPRQKSPSPSPQVKGSPTPRATLVPEKVPIKNEKMEENINGEDLTEDLLLTDKARSQGVTQEEIGVSQEEVTEKNMNNDSDPSFPVIQQYASTLPKGITLGLKYNQYNISYDYLLVLEPEVILRERPDPKASEVCKAIEGEKLTLLAKVEGKSQAGQGTAQWYRVCCRDKGNIQIGYVPVSTGQARSFRFQKMMDAVTALQGQVAQKEMRYVVNYKNYNGAAPIRDNNPLDEHGYRAYHSAAGYTHPDTGSPYRYIPDGMLLHVQGEQGNFYQVAIPSFHGQYWVEKKYIHPSEPLQDLTHVVVIDRKMQNQAAFEKTNGGWTLVSYTFSTTGLKGDFSYETPLGAFKALEKKDQFLYLKDGSDEIAGYAPYALRFSGGAYIHGVPVDYEIMDGQKKDPGTQEYLHTIGTFPRSHMCVRNYTSHARFIRDWMATKTGAVIVIE
jgi:hypothetical protein